MNISAETRQIVHDHVRQLSRDLYVEKLKYREAIARNVRLNNEVAALKQRIAELEAVQCIAS